MVVKKFSKIVLLPGWSWPVIDPDTENENMYTTRDTIVYESVVWIEKRKFWMSIYIPAGFRCDGQSTPRFLWSVMRPDGNVRLAAHAHDACYRTAGFSVKKDLGCRITLSLAPVFNRFPVILGRTACDQIYRDFYRQTAKNSRIKSQIGYMALRIGGKKHFGAEPPNK